MVDTPVDRRTVTLQMSLQDAEMVLNALMAQPYSRVSQLISRIMAEVQAQAKTGGPAVFEEEQRDGMGS